MPENDNEPLYWTCPKCDASVRTNKPACICGGLRSQVADSGSAVSLPRPDKNSVVVSVLITAKINRPKIGDGYGDYGICGRPGFYEAGIIQVTPTDIMLHDNGHGIMKNGRTIIPLSEYYFRKVMNEPKRDVRVKFGESVSQ